MSNNIELIEIDEIITSQLELIDDKLSKIEFEEICEFKLNDINSETTILNELDYRGIYLIEIKRDTLQDYTEWIDLFTKKFRGIEGDEKKFLHKFTPNVIEKRKYKHKEKNEEWIPFYIGKSKKIRSRVKIHLFSTLGKPPFALKLKERNIDGINVLGDETFKLKTIKVVDIKNYDVIVTHLEKQLRKKHNPIVGKQ
ncbi:hypothetical protein [Flavobacterium macrobrachii]|uniref:GIY-YIG nuclease family protein n=1 Tax=Flavobacterium macrobrachii TaxID=591204 RepID=A0ABS2CVS6_9FLAO|nr:hypothetical protein [Flavobacterium macrobrachii]MBM6499058.1 hypothetical protein [Flavobacterium macrobrachii]